MARKHYKPRKNKQRQDKPAEKAPVKMEKQPPRGETLQPAKHGGYTHSFQFYEYTIYPREAAK